MYTSKNNLMYPVEHLVFQLENQDNLNRFIQLDHEIWTMFLKEYPAFVSKQIWVNDTNPGEVHSIISWKTMEGWKSIPVEKLKEIDQKFTNEFNEPFKLVRRIHKENNHGIYEYCSFVK